MSSAAFHIIRLFEFGISFTGFILLIMADKDENSKDKHEEIDPFCICLITIGFVSLLITRFVFTVAA